MDEYKKRLGAYAKIQEIEVADEKAPEKLSEEDMRIVKKKGRRTNFSKNKC